MTKTVTNNTKTPRWFEFQQNNSGGSFVTDDAEGIGPHVWIQAYTPEQANDIAETKGIYFDGCQTGGDCPCCGDRWYRVWDGEDGSDTVEVSEEWDFNWHDTVYAHSLDGTIHRYRSGGLVVYTKPV